MDSFELSPRIDFFVKGKRPQDVLLDDYLTDDLLESLGLQFYARHDIPSELHRDSGVDLEWVLAPTDSCYRRETRQRKLWGFLWSVPREVLVPNGDYRTIHDYPKRFVRFITIKWTVDYNRIEQGEVSYEPHVIAHTVLDFTANTNREEQLIASVRKSLNLETLTVSLPEPVRLVEAPIWLHGKPLSGYTRIARQQKAYICLESEYGTDVVTESDLLTFYQSMAGIAS